MKKTVTIFTLILIALISFNSYAQSSKLIGTWYGNTTPINQQGMKGTMTPSLTLKEGNVGSFNATLKQKGSMGNGTTMEFTINHSAPCYWEFDGSNLYIQIDIYNATITVPKDKVKFTCKDPKGLKALNSSKDEFIELVKNEYFDPNILPDEAYWQNVSVTGNTLSFYEDGVKYIFKKKSASSGKSSSKKSTKKRR